MSTHRFLVLGCGSIGTRHARNLVELGHEVAVFDDDAERKANAAVELDIMALSSLEEAWASSPDAVVIATPTSSHLELAKEAARRGRSFFVEKPLSDTADGVAELVRSVRAQKLVTLVGCNMRFHPGVQALKRLVDGGTLGRILSARFEAGQYLPDWRPGSDYRSSYSAQRALGGGIVLDAIHELDYATWLLGEAIQIACFADHVSDLQIDTEDVAAILLRFRGGTIAEVHLDYVQRAYSRSAVLIGSLGTARWDYTKADLQLFIADRGTWETSSLFEGEWDPNSMYLDELRHFVRALDGEEAPLADVATGAASLAVALAAKRAAAEGLTVSPESFS
jgi:predicted dehydrogenase